MVGDSLEKEARQIIDSQLEKAGWKKARHDKKGKPVLTDGKIFYPEYPTASGPADYVLFIDKQPIGIVEAKKAVRDPYGALPQARRYAKDIQDFPIVNEDYRVPFIFTANSEEIWFQDVRAEAGLPRQIYKFHSPVALQDFQKVDYQKAKEWLKSNENKDKFLRYYQRTAIEKTEDALIKNKRRMLIAMATGTGKTFTVVSLASRLLKAKMFKRILFLVDRRELGDQAKRAFENFDLGGGLKFSNVYEVVNIEERSIPKASQVCICTLQRMFNLVKENGDGKKPDIDSFDCIISDECHRSIYGDWKIVLDYFDGVQIGLTATPATHTKAYFENMVYSYSYSEAVGEDFLVDYNTVRIETGITMQGLYYKDNYYSPMKLERKITVPDRNRKIIREFQKYSTEDQKTILFAISQAHALQLERLFNEEYSHHNGKFAQTITSDIDNAQGWIRRFRTRKYPKVAITVDMMSTGVDVPAVENLIFTRPTQSRILFEQMCGRGTRKCDDIGKTHFTVFDCIGIVDHFQKVSDFGTYRPKHMQEEVKEAEEELQPIQKRKMIIADDVQDQVLLSDYVFLTKEGKELKPEDYIKAFEKFVRENADLIDAIKILMEKPQKFSIRHLRELQQMLAGRPENFTERKLQTAYRQPLVDMVSFVKSAIKKSPMLTPEERVEHAFESWTYNRHFTPEQKQWLDLIKRHFVVNHRIEQGDFDDIPFSRHGGWVKADEVFNHTLSKLLDELNRAVLA